jgi:acyl carrier protein
MRHAIRKPDVVSRLPCDTLKGWHSFSVPMNTSDRIKRILRDALQLGARAESLTPAAALLGAIPELDSMAVVTILTMLEDEFGVAIADDEISADVFATLGTLSAFVDAKLAA